jgi:cytoskeletal protein RodZ
MTPAEPSTPTPLPSGLLGQELRNRRLQKNLSLETVFKDTRIHSKFLKAMEEEQWEAFPARVYAQGFLRQYANYLGLDGEDLSRRLRSLWGENDTQVPTAESPAAGDAPDGQPREGGSPAHLTIILASVFLLGSAYLFILKRESRPPAVKPIPVSPLPAGSHALRVSARETVWSRIRVDGAVKWQGILDPGTPKTWPVQSEVRVETSQTAALSVSLDGTDLPASTPAGSGEYQWTSPSELPPAEPVSATPPPPAPVPSAPVNIKRPALPKAAPPAVGVSTVTVVFPNGR